MIMNHRIRRLWTMYWDHPCMLVAWNPLCWKLTNVKDTQTSLFKWFVLSLACAVRNSYWWIKTGTAQCQNYWFWNEYVLLPGWKNIERRTRKHKTCWVCKESIVPWAGSECTCGSCQLCNTSVMWLSIRLVVSYQLLLFCSLLNMEFFPTITAL